jgi:hypothetical protein
MKNLVDDSETDGTSEVDRLELEWKPGSKTRTNVTAFIGDHQLHCDCLNFASETARVRFAKACVAKAKDAGFVLAILDAEVKLLAIGLKVSESIPDETVRPEAVYCCVENADGAEDPGMYRMMGKSVARITNFTARIDEEIVVEDDVAGSHDLVGRVRLKGRDREFRMAAKDYGSNDKLKSAMFEAAGSGAMLLDPRIDELRAAISSTSQPKQRVATTTHGWTKLDGEMVFVTGNGHVAGDGFNNPEVGGPPRFESGGDEVARRLEMTRLKPGPLAAARLHIVADLLRLHDRPVMFSLMASVAAAVLCSHAGLTQRFVLWLKGLTGAGKSFAAKLMMNFFGDFDPMPGLTQFASWIWTPNRIERTGYLHNNALMLIDDFKPEITPAYQALRVIQAYADGSGRARLRADSSTALIWPIRAQLVATGEDLFQHNASGLARAVVVDVANHVKDIARAERCLKSRPRYRGVMADFVAHLIREDRLSGFSAEYRSSRDYFLLGNEARQNAARICGNLGMLAASARAFGFYLSDVWPSWEDEIDAYVEEDLVAIRNDMLDLVQDHEASQIFMGELRTLIGARAVLVTDHLKGEGGILAGTVGRLYEQEGVIAISISRAMGEVQKSLRSQGRAELAVSERTLLEQLCRAGMLLNQGGHALDENYVGEKTFRRRIWEGEGQIRVALFPHATLLDLTDQGSEG